MANSIPEEMKSKKNNSNGPQYSEYLNEGNRFTNPFYGQKRTAITEMHNTKEIAEERIELLKTEGWTLQGEGIYTIYDPFKDLTQYCFKMERK